MPDGRATAEQRYLSALQAGRFDEALSCVYGLIERQDPPLSTPHKARYLLRLGALYAKLNQRGTAEFFYGLAIDCDAYNLPNMLAYAAFLFETDETRALRLCDEIIAAADEGECPDFIVKRARELKQRACAAMRPPAGAALYVLAARAAPAKTEPAVSV